MRSVHDDLCMMIRSDEWDPVHDEFDDPVTLTEESICCSSILRPAGGGLNAISVHDDPVHDDPYVLP